jgi:glyoxylase I family protein
MTKYWLDHFHLVSPDPVKAAEFHVKTFGATIGEIKHHPGGRISVNLFIGGVRTVIVSPKNTPPVPGNITTSQEHYGLGTDSLEAAVSEIKANGGKVVQEITRVDDGGRFCFVLTPQNILIEMVQRPK